MATRTYVSLVDDTDGTEADETVEFSIDGITYEIDLNINNADSLRALLAAYIAAGRRITPAKREVRRVKSAAKKHSKTQSPARRAQNARIRAWADKAGYVVESHGRVPNEVREQYFFLNPSDELVAL